MSFQATAWALRMEAGSSSAKCVLLCIANYADEDGYCWPGQERIARETEQSVDSVQRRLRELERRKLIQRQQRRPKEGRGRLTDLYRLNMGLRSQDVALIDQSRSSNAPKPQVCGVHIDEPSRTIKKQLQQTTGKFRRQPNKVNIERGTRGAIEVEIATRIGARGFEVLMELPDTEVERLCFRQRRGTLDNETIERLRASDCQSTGGTQNY